MRSSCATVLAALAASGITAACGETSGGISKQEAVRVARRVVGSQRGLRIEDVLERSMRDHGKALLVRFEAKRVRRQLFVPRPAQQCVLVWKASRRYRFQDPDVEFRPVQRLGRAWVLQDDCAKVEHIVGPLPAKPVR